MASNGPSESVGVKALGQRRSKGGSAAVDPPDHLLPLLQRVADLKSIDDLKFVQRAAVRRIQDIESIIAAQQ